jgi:hypothetical protein
MSALYKLFTGFGPNAAFTVVTNLQKPPVKDNTGFLLFLASFLDFSRSFRSAM